jgi:glyoxylase-like metal-dependent hydrolase (beta-lactamase superfamily II)
MNRTATVHFLALNIDMFGTPVNINPVLIADDQEATLIDAGYPGYFAQLKEAVEAAGVPFDHLRRVIITHHDWDHIGVLREIEKSRGDGVLVYAHVDEKPYIEGRLPNLKMTPERIAARLAALPESFRPKAAAMFADLPTGRVDRTVTDSQTLPFHGGITVIHTPGHTPGHICLFLPAHRLLVAGDELRVENGALVGPADIHTLDMPLATASLMKLTGYDVDRVACYHGGVYGPHAAESIARLAAALNPA